MMRFYSRSALSFVRRLERYAWDILAREMGLAVLRVYFECNGRYWRLKIACFEDPKILGYFDFESLLIGINRHLMLDASDEFLKNVLRHELAHYVCYILHGRDMADHGIEYRSLCRKYGWGREVYDAKVGRGEMALSLQRNREDEKVLARIKKLMALGSSSNRHESESATLKANELLVKYNLEKARMDADDMDEESHYVLVAARAKRNNATLRALADILRNFMVQPIFSRKTGHTALEIVGTRLNVELAAYVADFLRHEFERLWKKAQRENPGLKGMVAKNSFVRGLGRGLDRKLKEGKERTPTNGKGLVRLQSALDRAVEMAYPNLGTSYSGARHCPEGGRLGEREGKTISIHPGVSKDSGGSIELLN